MFETYRMLGEQREVELLREARRLQVGQAVKDGRILRTPESRFRSVLRRTAVVLSMRFRSSTARAEKLPLSQLDP